MLHCLSSPLAEATDDELNCFVEVSVNVCCLEGLGCCISVQLVLLLWLLKCLWHKY